MVAPLRALLVEDAEGPEVGEGREVLGDPDARCRVAEPLLEVALEGHLDLHDPEQGPGDPVLAQDLEEGAATTSRARVCSPAAMSVAS
jgi:hypothetical protein